MKTSARFLAMLLAVVMIASAALSVSAFSDVKAGVEHADAISVLSQLGVIGGYADGTFKPDQAVTRAEMAKLVYVLYTTFVDAGAGSVKFDDVKADNWAAGYISWCYNKGIIGGYGNGKFGPADNVTYDQALKMVCGALGYNNWDSALWPVDVRTKALRDLDLGENIPATVNGSDALTRGQVAQIMYNALFAPMNEKLTVNRDYVDANGNTFTIPTQIDKVLATHVWNFTETSYRVVGTENYNLANYNLGTDKSLVLAKLDSKGNLLVTKKTVGGQEVDVYEVYAGDSDLETLGLAQYEDKTDALIGLNITLVEKDGKLMETATVSGNVTDNVALKVSKDNKTLTIGGVNYTIKSDEIPAVWTLGANIAGAAFFSATDLNDGENGAVGTKANEVKLAYRDALEAAYMARTIDSDGDGDADAVIIVPKTVYKAKKPVTVSGVKNVNYETLTGSAGTRVPLENVTADLKEGDIFVGALMGDTLYAEVIKPVDAIATGLNQTAGKITLKDIGEVKYLNVTVAGVNNGNISTDALTTKNAYYIYGDEVVYTTASSNTKEYNFAILRDIEFVDTGDVDNTTMTAEGAYIATLIIDGVEKKVTVNAATGVKVNGQALDLRQNNPYARDTDANGKIEYKYAIVTRHADSIDGYKIQINEDIDGADDQNTADVVEGTEFVVLPAGAKFSYNSETGLYSFTYTQESGNSGLNVEKIVLDDNSSIFYRYMKENTQTGTFKFLGEYNKADIVGKNFNELTYGETYLALNADGKTYTLLATLLDSVIDVIDADAEIYVNDGSLILYAPEGSTIVRKEDKNYNSYIFMNAETFENGEPVLDDEKNVYDATTNPGTVAGGLYGKEADGKYTKLTSASNVDTIQGAYLDEVLTAHGLIYYKNSADASTQTALKVDDSVVIWGLAEAAEDDKYENGVYTQLTLDDLASMMQVVAEYNELDNDASNDIDVRIIVLYDKEYVLSETKRVPVFIIVEIFELDAKDDTKVNAVNSKIFEEFFVPAV